MAHCEVLRGPRGEDKPCPDLHKHSIALHFVHAWGRIKCHNLNKLNNSNGIQKIQSKVSLKCKLPWSHPEQTTGEEGNMTALSTPPPTKHTQNKCSGFSCIWIPLATAVEKLCGDRKVWGNCIKPRKIQTRKG